MRRLTVLLFLLLAAPAHAADPVVLRDGGHELRAGAGDPVCVSIDRADTDCDLAPRTPFDPVVVGPSDGDAIGGAVAPGVARAELQLVDGTRRDAAFSGGYFLASGVHDLVLIRFYDGLGALVGAWQEVPRAFAVDTVLRARGVRVEREQRLTLAATPLAIDRTFPTTCLRAVTGGAGTESCFDERTRPAGVSARGVTVCRPGRSVVVGAVGPAVTRVELVLGDGTTRRRAIDGAVFAALVPRGMAVREVRALDAAGTVLGRDRVGLGPSGRRCVRGSGILSILDTLVSSVGAPPVAGARAVAEARGHRLLVADSGEDAVCAGLDRLTRLGCDPAPVSDRFAILQRQGRFVFGVLSRFAARVDLTLDRGKLSLAAEATRYGGRYDGLVRFVLGTLPAGRVVRDVIPRDAAGEVLGIGNVFNPGRHAKPVTLLRRGGLRVRLRDGVCIELVLAGRGSGCLPLGDAGSASAVVRCAPRQAVVYGIVGRRAAAPVVRLSDGRTLRSALARRVALHTRAWVVRVPRDARVRSVRIGRRTLPLDVPAASRQCGYGTSTLPFG